MSFAQIYRPQILLGQRSDTFSGCYIQYLGGSLAGGGGGG